MYHFFAMIQMKSLVVATIIFLSDGSPGLLAAVADHEPSCGLRGSVGIDNNIVACESSVTKESLCLGVIGSSS